MFNTNNLKLNFRSLYSLLYNPDLKKQIDIQIDMNNVDKKLTFKLINKQLENASDKFVKIIFFSSNLLTNGETKKYINPSE